MKGPISSLAAGMFVYFAASTALAQQAGMGSSFATAGTLAVGAERLFGFTHSSFKVEDENPPPAGTTTSTTTVDTFSVLGKTPFSTDQFSSPYSTPRFGIDFFPIDGLSLGGSLTYIGQSGETEVEEAGQSQSADNDSATGFLIAPRVGYGIMFNDIIGLWPRGGITYFVVNVDNRNSQGVTTSERTLNGLALSVEVPLILSPIDHVAFTVGPSLDFPLSGTIESDPVDPASPTQETDFKVTDIGVNAGLLVWF
jgi:hypothetical protein